ncbi:Cytidine and deoxycytidylate deaminase zinc-binding region [Micromonospora viridifaciens]|uniref:Cytidine and deoxycytidylate deaminase zinc-binding region n=1 Tax=Micromonospora viridifaciens TaxID=1881 RepID=A0A1C4WZE5_MICVI|nr:nucleoside deaminase [Micromonospora viridifaciens]SCF01580.1 Cytidine and deoxycytidylate deaminase zinc-binding region [Micromonospora viridifaciens]
MTAVVKQRLVGEAALTTRDQELLRQAFADAKEAGRAGERPFAAIVFSRSGRVLASAINTQVSTGDFTMHAELSALRQAVEQAGRSQVEGATLYASSEPCAMCSAGAFFAGIGRIVFGTSASSTYALLPRPGSQLAMNTACVLGSGDRDVIVIGPALEQEGLSHLREARP